MLIEKRYRGLLVVASLLLTAACATPQPVVRLSPRDPSAKWVQGLGVMVQKNDGVRVALAYDRNVEHRIAFRVEVVNDSGAPVHLDPRQSVCSFCRSLPGPDDLSRACPQRFRMIDPEREALNAELAQSRSKAEEQDQLAVTAGLIFLSAATDAVASSKGRPSNSSSSTLLIHDNGVRNMREQTRYASAVEFWQSAPLRRTTLDPADATSGLLLVDSVPFVPLVLVSVEVGPRRFRFAFDQKTMTPYKTTPTAEDRARLHRTAR